MNMSRRAKRMEKNHKKNKQAGLNLVSLMDIFTILVFFLLVNSSSVQQLPSHKDIKLPTSVAKKAVKDTLVISITADSIIVQGNKVADVKDVMVNKDDVIPQLATELTFRFNKGLVKTSKDKGKAVTIMGDENIPYELLRKILATCRQTNYTHIAFAAVQKVKGKTS